MCVCLCVFVCVCVSVCIIRFVCCVNDRYVHAVAVARETASAKAKLFRDIARTRSETAQAHEALAVAVSQLAQQLEGRHHVARVY